MEKILIASDIHGDAVTAERLVQIYKEVGAKKLLLLGDILYHGPRNELPDGYAPKKVIELLNGLRNDILAVRGNCDTEVDQMVLSFPILADYAYISVDGLSIFATHGHKFNLDSLPPLAAGEILLHGHTHVPAATEFGNENLYINPGSISIPKESSPKGYILYENGIFSFRTLEGEEYKRYSLKRA